MRNLLWVIMSILLLFCACGAEAGDAPSTGEALLDTHNNVPESSTEKTAEIVFMHPSLPEFADESLFALEDIAKDYVRMDYAQFCDAHSVGQLYADGIVDAASFIIGETRYENVIGGSTLVFTNRHTKPVADDIGVGVPMELVRDIFGEPGFINTEYNLIGYKTRTFYIAFSGTQTVEDIYLSRRYSQTEADDLLPEFYKTDKKGGFPFEEWNMASTQLWRASMTHYSPSGLCIWSGYDDDFNDFYPVTVYSDYEGQLPGTVPQDSAVYFENMDYPEHKILAACREEALIQDKLAAGLEPAFYSPSKSIAILPFSNCTYERSGYLLRHLDSSAPDRFLSFGHFPDAPVWLNNRYIGVNTMYGFGIYDVNDGGHYRIDSPFYIDDATYAGLWVVDPVQQGDALVIRGEEMVVHQNGEETLLTLNPDEQLLLKFHYDASGALAVEYTVEKQQ